MRNISFALTTEQIRNRTKTVTRRLGWTFLREGDLLQPVVKAQGLRKGEHVEKIGGPVRVVNVRREYLRKVSILPSYGRDEVIREGFRGLTRTQFVKFFAVAHQCDEDVRVTRIEFEYIDVVTDTPATQPPPELASS